MVSRNIPRKWLRALDGKSFQLSHPSKLFKNSSINYKYVERSRRPHTFYIQVKFLISLKHPPSDGYWSFKYIYLQIINCTLNYEAVIWEISTWHNPTVSFNLIEQFLFKKKRTRQPTYVAETSTSIYISGCPLDAVRHYVCPLPTPAALSREL